MTDTHQQTTPEGNGGFKFSLGTIVVIVLAALVLRFVLKAAVEIIFWVVIIGLIVAVASFIWQKIKNRTRGQ